MLQTKMQVENSKTLVNVKHVMFVAEKTQYNKYVNYYQIYILVNAISTQISAIF